jgi:hypothetical protein
MAPMLNAGAKVHTRPPRIWLALHANPIKWIQVECLKQTRMLYKGFANLHFCKEAAEMRRSRDCSGGLTNSFTSRVQSCLISIKDVPLFILHNQATGSRNGCRAIF